MPGGSAEMRPRAGKPVPGPAVESARIQWWRLERPLACQKSAATWVIETLALLDGALPPRALGLVTEWAALHRDELSANWRRAREQAPLQPIAPLE